MEELKKLNPEVLIEEETEHVNFKNLWNDETCIDKSPKQILRTVKNNIERIRNTLVHLRESRENKIILPTEKNNNLLIPNLFVVRRLAEKVALIHRE